MSNAVDPLAITVGTGCNIRCRHCLVEPGLGSESISEEEIRSLVLEINKFSPGDIVFTGGEPTLYLRQIQQILSGISIAVPPKVTLITNGYFSGSRAEAERVLNGIAHLYKVVVSYDRFHAEFVEKRKISILLDVCRDLGLQSKIVCAVETPMDLVFLNSLRSPGLAISIQQILPMGRAKKNGMEYRCASFDRGVLDKKCPNLGGMVFNCGSGFTVCCGPLASFADKSEYVHVTISEHLESVFYRILSEHTFGELAAVSGWDTDRLTPEHSVPCRICAALIPGIIEKARAGGDANQKGL
jgi:hypothetical protein